MMVRLRNKRTTFVSARYQIRRRLRFENLEFRIALAVNIAAVRPDLSENDKLLRFLLDTEQLVGVRNDQPEIAFHYGKSKGSTNPGGLGNTAADDVAIAGDWNGIGFDFVGTVRANQSLSASQFLLDSDRDATPEYQFVFGSPGNTPLVGNFDGKNGDDVAVVEVADVKPGDSKLHWQLSYAKAMPNLPFPTDGSRVATHAEFFFGDVGDKPVVGDFDGDHRADLAVMRETGTTLEFYVLLASNIGANYPTGRTLLEVPVVASLTFQKSSGGLLYTPIAGDWDGDGTDNLGVATDFGLNTISQWRLNTLGGTITVNYGLAGDQYLTGNWPDVLWDAGGGDQRWSNPNNWSNNLVPSLRPGNQVKVVIAQPELPSIIYDSSNSTLTSFTTTSSLQVTGGTLDFSSPAELASIEITGGVVTAQASLGKSVKVTVNGGTFKANQILDVASFEMTSGLLQFGVTNPFGNIELRLSGGQVENSGTLLRLDNNIVLSNTVAFSATQSFSIGGVISGSGSLEKRGPSFLNLEAVNTYSGSTTISQGELLISQTNGLRAGSTVTVAAGALLNLEERSSQLAAITGTGSVQIKSPGSLTIGLNDASNRFNGMIIGSGSLTKVGTGTLTLGGLNTFTGDTTISAGSIALGVNNSLAPQSVVSIASTAKLELISSTAVIRGVTGDGLLDVGSGRITLNNPSAIGSIRIDAGRLIANANLTATEITFTAAGGELTTELPNAPNGDTVRITSNISLNGVAKLGGVGYLIINGVIAGGGTLEKIGTGTLVLVASNTYAGVTTITDGILVAEGSNALGTSTAGTVVNGGILAFGGNAAPAGFEAREPLVIAAAGRLDLLSNVNLVAPLTLAGNVLGDIGSSITGDVLLTGNATITQRSATGVLSLLGAITDSVQPSGVFFNSPSGGTVTLNNPLNSYRGATVVQAGTLRVTASEVIPNSSSVTVASGASLDLGNFNETVFSLTTAGLVSVGSGTFSVLDDVLITTGSLAVTSGIIKLSGDFTNTGTFISGTGTLEFNAPLGIQLLSPGGSDLNNLLHSGAGTLQLQSDLIVLGTLANTAGVIDLGDRTVAVTGGLSNATGATLRTNGRLRLASDFINQGTLTTITGTIELTGPASTTQQLNLGNSSVNNLTHSGLSTVQLANNLIVNGNLSNNAGTFELGARNVVVTGKASNESGATLRSGASTIRIAGDFANAGNFVAGTGTLEFDGPSGVTQQLISGGSSLNNVTHSGAGTLLVEGNLQLVNRLENRVGVINIDGRQLSVAEFALFAGEIIDSRSTGNLNASTLFDLRDGEVNVNLSGQGRLVKSTTSAVVLSGNLNISGSTTIEEGTLKVGDAATIARLERLLINERGIFDLNSHSISANGFDGAGKVFLGTGTLTAIVPETSTFSGTISGLGGFIKTGVGTLRFTGANSYQGDTKIEQGTLALSGVNNLRQSANVSIEGESSLELRSGQQTLAGLEGPGTLRLLSSRLVIDQAEKDLLFAGTLAGDGSIRKTGAGALALIGSGDFNGSLDVQGGSLKANGRFPKTAIAIQSGASLQGNGTLGDVTVAAGGTLRPGNSPGKMTVDNLFMNAGSKLIFEIAGPNAASQFDQMAVSGLAALNGEIEVQLLNGYVPSALDVFDLILFSATSGSPSYSLPTLNGIPLLRERFTPSSLRLSVNQLSPAPKSGDGTNTNQSNSGRESVPDSGTAPAFTASTENTSKDFIVLASVNSDDKQENEIDATEWIQQPPESLPIDPAARNEAVALEMIFDAIFAEESFAELSLLASDAKPLAVKDLEVLPLPSAPKETPPPVHDYTIPYFEIAAGTALLISGLSILAVSLLKPRKKNREPESQTVPTVLRQKTSLQQTPQEKSVEPQIATARKVNHD